MKDWSIHVYASISVTITDIWTKFGTEHKHHTTTRWNGQIHINWKSKMAAAAILNFGKISMDWIKTSCIKLYGKMHHGDAEMINRRPKVETGSKFAWRHQMKVWSICASISLTITYIWTKFGTEHKYHTTNTPEWPNSHTLKIQDGGGRHLGFRKNVNNFGLDKDILHQIIWKDAPRRRGDDHVTKSRNRKLIRVTSSN